MKTIEEKWENLKNANVKELQEAAKEIRKMLPSGSIIKLIKMYDDPQPVPPGTYGEVKFIDGFAKIHVKWQTGSGLALIPGIDRFEIISEKEENIK